MSEEKQATLSRSTADNVFAASAAMLGVCVTMIGLLRVVVSLRNVDTIADDIMALNSFVFLAACLFSYWALRSRDRQRLDGVERVADMLFILGLGILGASILFITFVIAF